MIDRFILIALISVASAPLLALISHKEIKVGASFVSLLSSCIHFVCATWILYAAVSSGSQSVVSHLELAWFTLAGSPQTNLALSVEGWNASLWFTLAFIHLLSEYFRIVDEKSESVSATVGRSTLILGVFLALLSENVGTFFFGWCLSTLGTFLCIATNKSKSNDGSAAVLYFVFSLVSDLVLIIGILGLFSRLFQENHGEIAFQELNRAIVSSRDFGTGSISLVVLGIMLKSFQFPFMHLTKYVTTVDSNSPLLFILGTLLPVTALLSRIYPVLGACNQLIFFAMIPALTSLIAALFSLSEIKGSAFLPWSSVYLCGSALLSLLVGGFQAAQMEVLFGCFALLVLWMGLEFAPRGAYALIAFGFVLACFMGLPLLGFAGGRLLEYTSIVTLLLKGEVMAWGVIIIKVIADIVFGLACWGLFRAKQFSENENIDKKSKPTPIGMNQFIPMLLSMVCSISVVFGGKLFSGAFGESGDLTGAFFWIEKLLGHFESNSGDSEFFAKAVFWSVMILPSSISLLWIFRSKEQTERCITYCKLLARKLDSQRAIEIISIDLIGGKLGGTMSKATIFIEEELFNKVFARTSQNVRNFIYRCATLLDDRFADRLIIDGLNRSVSGIGRALRLLHNGQVQFYLAFGLIVMALIVIHSLIKVGG